MKELKIRILTKAIVKILVLIFSTFVLAETHSLANKTFLKDSCIIEPYKDQNKAGYTINGNKQELFVRSQERGFCYFFSKEGQLFTSNTSDTAIYTLAKYTLKEYNGHLFVNGKLIGKAQKGDYIIVRNDMIVEIYDSKKVRIK